MSISKGHNVHLIRTRRVPMWVSVVYAPLGVLLDLLSLLPLWMLYPLADVLGYVAYRIVGYRRKIVERNIADSFPDFDEATRRRIVRRFYRRLGDYFVETLKMRTMVVKGMKRRMTFEGAELVDDYLRQGRDIVIYTSHFGNWEWITSFALWCREYPESEFAHVYRPLKHPWFDRWWLRLRGRFNSSVPMKTVMRQLLMWRRSDRHWITGFLSDQKPSHAGSVIEVDFLGRPTPFIYGTEELARRLGAVVMLFDTEIRGRGQYHSTIRLITDNPGSLPEGEITRRYVDNLTQQIRRCPEGYLWSHNRWRLPRH